MHKEIDPNQIALMGISMGGYLAARAAAFEDRISACILYNGVYDGYDVFASGFPKSLYLAVKNDNVDIVNSIVEILSDLDANMRFNLKHGIWTTGISSPFELIQGSKKYCQRYNTKNKVSNSSS
jgi:hypothetical protein